MDDQLLKGLLGGGLTMFLLGIIRDILTDKVKKSESKMDKLIDAMETHRSDMIRFDERLKTAMNDLKILSKLPFDVMTIGNKMKVIEQEVMRLKKETGM